MGLSKNVLIIAVIFSICSCRNAEESDKPKRKVVNLVTTIIPHMSNTIKNGSVLYTLKFESKN
jgi:hypothetical protein